MTAIVPKLDDIEFDRLVEDGRDLIPRFAPEWTDHNLHDPGITLIDLIAFLVDQQVYRIGFVGESLRRAFTRLMGVAPRGPKAAQVLIWPRSEGVPVLDLEPGTEIETPDVIEARFTLDAHVRTVAARIIELATVTGDELKPLGIGLTEGRDALRLLPHAGGGPRALEITLSKRILPLDEAGFVSLGVSLAGGPGAEGPAWESLTIEQWDAGGFWRPLQIQDRTKGLRTTGVILFRLLDTGPAKKFRVRLDQGFRPGTVTIDRVALNVLPAIEGWDDPDKVLSEGNGLPEQAVELRTRDIVDLDCLRIETNIAGDERQWEAREDFVDSGPFDAHYRITEDGVVFGNGLNGMMVPRGAQIRRGRVRRTQGACGAVAKGLIWRIVGIDYGINAAPSSAGRDRDGLQNLVQRARELAKCRVGVLRSEDLEAELLAGALGLEGVKVTPGRRPGLENTEAPGSRTVLILPVRDPSESPGPAVATLQDAAEALIAPARLLGERIHVSHPIYRHVDVEASLVVKADADLAEVQTEAEQILRARLWDLRRAPDQEIDPWPAGRTVTVGEIEGLMAEIDQVVRVPKCWIGVSGAALGRSCLPLCDREIALAGRIDIRVTRQLEGGEP